MRAVLHPEPMTPVAILPDESPKAYLLKCERNIRAEIWGMYTSSRMIMMDEAVLTIQRGSELLATGDDAAEVEWNLLAIRGSKYLALPSGSRNTVRLLRGKRFKDSGAPEGNVVGACD